MRVSTILTVVLASVLPFSDLIFAPAGPKIVQQYQQGLSILMGTSKYNKNVIDPQTIVAMNLQIHALNAVLLLILEDQFLKSQRCYGQQLRESACLIAVILFAVHPGRMEYLGKVTESSVLQQFSICLSLVGVILTMNFLSRKKWRSYSLMQAALSGAFISGGVFLGAPVTAFPLLLYAAVMFQQIRCHLSLLNASILTLSHGIWAALAGLLRINCVVATDAAVWMPVCHTVAPGSILLTALRTYNDAVTTTVTNISKDPTRHVAVLEKIAATTAANTLHRLEAILAQLMETAGAASLSRTAQLIGGLVELLLPAIAILLFLWVTCHGIHDAIHWRPMTNGTFCCVSLFATVLLSAPSMLATLLDIEALVSSLYTCVPSAFLSLCLAVSLADAWGAPMVISAKGEGVATDIKAIPHVQAKGFLVSKVWHLLAIASLCLGLQSYKETTRCITKKEDVKVSFTEFSASFSRSNTDSHTTS